jgi:hypothetical protein
MTSGEDSRFGSNVQLVEKNKYPCVLLQSNSEV